MKSQVPEAHILCKCVDSGHGEQGDRNIARRPYKAPPTRNEGPRANERIEASKVQLIDHEGANLGIMAIAEAMKLAEDAGLDLVEVSARTVPPVCKILDLGKYKYQSQKRAAEARKKQKTIDVKEIKIRPNIDTHDYDIKMRLMRRFFEEGDKVKVTLRFRGREMAHQDQGVKLLDRLRGDVDDIAKPEFLPKMEGRQMIMILGPR